MNEPLPYVFECPECEQVTITRPPVPAKVIGVCGKCGYHGSSRALAAKIDEIMSDE